MYSCSFAGINFVQLTALYSMFASVELEVVFYWVAKDTSR